MAEQKVVRRLIAILAADVVGYSRLVGRDEEGTLARLTAVREEVIDPSIARHDGRIVKTMGDGVLVEFPSVVDAVRNAVEVQTAMAERNAAVPEDQRLEFRVGVNLGDVVVQGDDILGDGVNIAARLEGLAEPGGICVSDVVYQSVRGKLDLTYDDLGEQKVKNIAEPVSVYRVRLAPAGPGAEAAAAPAGRSLELPDKPSIAVLPFVNMSGDPEQEYFSDGITEDIITELSRNRLFFVISRSTSFTFKGKTVDVARVAKELGVRFVLEGSVRKAGNRVRITAQLIEGTTDHHIWAERYDRELEEIFEVQDEITGNIVGAIAPGIMSAEIRRAQRKDSQQLDAWDRTMRAHWHIRRFTREDYHEAVRLLSEALELDPENATALSDLAFASHFDAVLGWSDAPAESFARMSDAARRAVAADDRDAYAHTARAIDELFSNRHADAVRRLERAIDLDPNAAVARGYLGATYCFSAEYDLAIKNLELAIRLSPRDPLIVIWHCAMGWASLNAERYEEAAEFARQARQDNPDFADTYSVLAAALGQLGQAEEARAALDELTRRLPDLTVGDARLKRPLKRPADQERFLDGLRKAGLPD